MASLVWRAAPVDAFARVTLAIAVLSLEMQTVTLLGTGSLSSIALVNVALGAFWIVASPGRSASSARSRSGPIPYTSISKSLDSIPSK